MEENKETDKEEEKAIESPQTEEKAEGEDYVTRAEKAALDIKESLTRREEILKREEKLLARQEALRALGGGSMAGQKPQEKQEMTPAEYKRRIEAGEVPERKK